MKLMPFSFEQFASTTGGLYFRQTVGLGMYTRDFAY